MLVAELGSTANDDAVHIAMFLSKAGTPLSIVIDIFAAEIRFVTFGVTKTSGTFYLSRRGNASELVM